MRGERHGFECKYSDAPGSTRSMRVAMEDLGLAHLWVVYPGQDRYALDDRITVIPARGIPELLHDLHAVPASGIGVQVPFDLRPGTGDR